MNIRHLSLIILYSFISLNIYAQNEVLNEKPNIAVKSISLQNLLIALEQNQNLSFSYNASNFDLDKIVSNPSRSPNIRSLLLSAFDNQIDLRTGRNRKVFIVYKERAQRITGSVTDKLTGERLANVLISISQDPSAFAMTNAEGVYLIETSYRDSIDISYKLFGSEALWVKAKFPKKPIHVEIKPGLLPDILILDTPFPKNESQQIFIENASLFPSLLGETDVINTLKLYPQVNTGSEGQNGLIVRGGNTDQNLILVDGVPIYEMSHLGGLSSIFVDNSIKNTEVYTSGFPANFSGRLSSVIDIQLKEGNKKAFNGVVQSSLLGLKAQVEGPLVNDRTSINASGRFSWFNPYLSPIIEDLAELDRAQFNYYDFQAKISHNFSTTNKLSIGYYKGKDEIQVAQSDNEESELAFENDNRLEWGNEVLNLQWRIALNDNQYLHTQAYYNSYDLFSRGIYNYEVLNDDFDKESREFDAFTYSSIRDYGFKSRVDYHYGNSSKLSYGFNYVRHRYTPNIVQSRQVIPDNEILDTLFDEVIYADEYGIFIQSDNNINTNWNLQSGLNISLYNNETSFVNLEPRFMLSYKQSKKLRFQLGLSRMVQAAHQLINPGIGLPSELNVPSTQNVKPETADEISINMNYNISRSFDLSVSAYYKSFQNIIDYQETTDLFFYILNDADFVPPFNSGANWESRVIVGEGRSRGLEFLLNYKTRDFKTWLSYTLAKSERKFPGVLEGNYFPYRNDFRHDVSIGIVKNISDRLDLSLLWIYNTGRRYTLATETLTTSTGQVVPIPPDRNNQKFPAFHHFDINIKYSRAFGLNSLTINAGIYNVYNRFNPYYLYLTENENQTYKLRQISLFPLLPKLSAVFKF